MQPNRQADRDDSLTCTEGGRYGVQGGRQQQWAAGSIGKAKPSKLNNVKSADTLAFEVDMAGILDGGLAAYAAAGKIVPGTAAVSRNSGAPDRYVTFVWLTGDFFGTLDYPVAQQGWDSTLLTARELFIKTINNVVDDSAARETGSWKIASQDEQAGVVAIETLGQVPVREAISAYKTEASQTHSEAARSLTGRADSATTPFSRSPESRFYLLEANLTFPKDARGSESVKAGFQIHGSDLEYTNIYYRKFVFHCETHFSEEVYEQKPPTNRSSWIAASPPPFRQVLMV